MSEKKWATGQSFILKEKTSYKIGTLIAFSCWQKFGCFKAKIISKRRSAHSKVLLLRAYLKVIFHETMNFSFILGSNRPNQMPQGIRENFCTPRGAWGRGGGA